LSPELAQEINATARIVRLNGIVELSQEAGARLFANTWAGVHSDLQLIELNGLTEAPGPEWNHHLTNQLARSNAFIRLEGIKTLGSGIRDIATATKSEPPAEPGV
jgi:hypothetical protein